jgi:thiamine-monophosphate kinase
LVWLVNEFDFISEYLAPLAGPGGLGLKDDAAILKPREGMDLILTKDTMVEGVHFPTGNYGTSLSSKLLRVNLSDLAAKGAIPIGYLLSVALPKTVGNKFFKDFSDGLNEVQKLFDLNLLGGDTVVTEGKIVITATLIGEVPSGSMVKRDGAKVGNSIWVSGTLGDAYLGLKTIFEANSNLNINQNDIKHFRSAYYSPVPRLLVAKQLRKYATACIDISDGLVADALHLSQASNVNLTINIDDIPISDQSQRWLLFQSDYDEALKNFLNWGDDYELLFTSNSNNDDLFKRVSSELGLRLTKIGKVRKGEGVNVLKAKKLISFDKTGHKHMFANNKML